MDSETRPRLATAWDLFYGRRPDLAEREVRRCLSLAPEDPEAMALLAMSLAYQQRYAEALAAADDAARVAPEHPEVRKARAEVFMQSGDTRRAEQAARELLEMDPLDPRHHEMMAWSLMGGHASVFQSRWRSQEALKAAETGLSIDPENVGCMLQRAQALVRLRRLKEARETMDEVMRLAPESQAAQAVHGYVMRKAGNAREGRIHLRDALRMDPTDRWTRDQLNPVLEQAYRDRAAILVQLREWRTAVRLVLAAQVAGTCLALALRGAETAAFLALHPLAFVAYPRVLRHMNRDDRHLDQDAAGMEAFLPRERKWARIVIVFSAVVSLGAFVVILI